MMFDNCNVRSFSPAVISRYSREIGLSGFGRLPIKLIMNQILSVAVVTVVLMTSTEAQTTLAPKWEVGKTLNYEIEDNAHTKMSGDDDEFFELRTTLTLDTKWKVNKVLDDGSVELDVSIDRVRFSADGKGMAALGPKLEFDSNVNDVPKVNPGKLVALVLKEYVGPAATVTINRRGGVTGFSASKDLAKLWKSGGVTEVAGFYGDIFMLDGVMNRLIAGQGIIVPKWWRVKSVGRLSASVSTSSGPCLLRK